MTRCAPTAHGPWRTPSMVCDGRSSRIPGDHYVRHFFRILGQDELRDGESVRRRSICRRQRIPLGAELSIDTRVD